MPARIQATDQIMIAAAPAEVWRVLTAFDTYHRWWPRNVRVTAVSTPADLIGTVLEIHPKGGPPFQCRLETAAPESELVFRYVEGPYQGIGTWRLAWTGAGTQVTYRADLTSDHWLLRFFARLTDLGGAHSRLMQPVLAGLRRAVTGRPDPRERLRSDPLG